MLVMVSMVVDEFEAFGHDVMMMMVDVIAVNKFKWTHLLDV